VGKGARLRREQHADPAAQASRSARRRARLLDGRNRKVKPTIEAYERLSALGGEGVARALLARYNARMSNLAGIPDYIRVSMVSPLGPIPILDKALGRYGADLSRPPSAYVGSWADHLLWAVDSAVAASRLMLSGQFVGAAAIARNQMERWLMHRAYNAGLRQEAGESTLDYVARVWSAPDHFTETWFNVESDTTEVIDEGEGSLAAEPPLDHEHIELTDGTEICPAVVYGLLSELLHGRDLLEALEWESEELLIGGDPPPELGVAVGVIADAISLCLRQVRLAVGAIAQETGDLGTLDAVDLRVDRFSPAEFSVEEASQAGAKSQPSGPVTPPLETLAPLAPLEGLMPGVVATIEGMAGVFAATMLGERPAGRLFRDDEFVTYAFAWHRLRSVRTATRALEAERDQFGEEFNMDSLTGRVARWAILSEATSLLGLWRRGSEFGAAMAVVGSGIRSAYWLWLEDDDRAMAVLRSVLEQVARSRAWRLKPERAAKLESRVETRPRDWIEAAGWKRLTALNRALGEFAHVKETTRWSGARELLARLQLDADPDTALFTARGAALEFVSMLAAEEVIASAEELSPVVAGVFRSLFEELNLTVDEPAMTLEQRFNHVWAHRADDLGDNDFVGPGTTPLR